MCCQAAWGRDQTRQGLPCNSSFSHTCTRCTRCTRFLPHLHRLLTPPLPGPAGGAAGVSAGAAWAGGGRWGCTALTPAVRWGRQQMGCRQQSHRATGWRLDAAWQRCTGRGPPRRVRVLHLLAAVVFGDFNTSIPAPMKLPSYSHGRQEQRTWRSLACLLASACSSSSEMQATISPDQRCTSGAEADRLDTTRHPSLLRQLQPQAETHHNTLAPKTALNGHVTIAPQQARRAYEKLHACLPAGCQQPLLWAAARHPPPPPVGAPAACTGKRASG